MPSNHQKYRKRKKSSTNTKREIGRIILNLMMKSGKGVICKYIDSTHKKEGKMQVILLEKRSKDINRYFSKGDMHTCGPQTVKIISTLFMTLVLCKLDQNDIAPYTFENMFYPKD